MTDNRERNETTMTQSSEIRSPWDLPAATSRGSAHDEWLIDESIAETFPASDVPVPMRPGSLVGSRYAVRPNNSSWGDTRQLIDSVGPWLAAVVVGALVWLILSLSRRESSRHR